MIKQANDNDIKIIEDILLDAVIWMRHNNLDNLWNEISIKWSSLCNAYNIKDFFINYVDNVPAGCIAITNYDQEYWPETLQGKSLYIHKLAVKRDFAGKGISKELITFAKNLSMQNNINCVRLDCNYNRKKLRSLYENEGFIFKSKVITSKNYVVALYEYKN